MQAEVAPSAAVAPALLGLQQTLTTVGVVQAKTFLIGLAAVLAVEDDVLLAPRHVNSHSAVHRSILRYMNVAQHPNDGEYHDEGDAVNSAVQSE